MSKGYIYFIQQGLDGQIKIGYSQDPKDRLKTLQTSNPRELRLLLTLQGNEDYERKLHKQFERHKLKGEWFEPHEDVLIFIENNKSGDVALERIENTILGLQSEIEELKRENVELKKTISNFRKESEFDLFLKSQKLSIHSDDHENHLEADFYIKKIHSIDLNWRFRGGELGVYGDLDIPMLGNESEKFYLFDGSNNYFIIDFFAKIMNLNIQDNPRFFAETLWDAESDLEIAKLYFLEYSKFLNEFKKIDWSEELTIFVRVKIDEKDHLSLSNNQIEYNESHLVLSQIKDKKPDDVVKGSYILPESYEEIMLHSKKMKERK